MTHDVVPAVVETMVSVQDEQLAKTIGTEDVMVGEIPGAEVVVQSFAKADVLPWSGRNLSKLNYFD